MNVKWDDVKEDYARKDARIKELEGKLSVALGLSNVDSIHCFEDLHWSDIPMCLDKNALIRGMRECDISGAPEDYSCAADLMSDVFRAY